MRNIPPDKIRSALTGVPALAKEERNVKRVDQLLGLCDALETTLVRGGATRLAGGVRAGEGLRVIYV